MLASGSRLRPVGLLLVLVVGGLLSGCTSSQDGPGPAPSPTAPAAPAPVAPEPVTAYLRAREVEGVPPGTDPLNLTAVELARMPELKHFFLDFYPTRVLSVDEARGEEILRALGVTGPGRIAYVSHGDVTLALSGSRSGFSLRGTEKPFRVTALDAPPGAAPASAVADVTDDELLTQPWLARLLRNETGTGDRSVLLPESRARYAFSGLAARAPGTVRGFGSGDLERVFVGYRGAVVEMRLAPHVPLPPRLLVLVETEGSVPPAVNVSAVDTTSGRPLALLRTIWEQGRLDRLHGAALPVSGEAAQELVAALSLEGGPAPHFVRYGSRIFAVSLPEIAPASAPARETVIVRSAPERKPYADLLPEDARRDARLAPVVRLFPGGAHAVGEGFETRFDLSAAQARALREALAERAGGDEPPEGIPFRYDGRFFLASFEGGGGA